MKFVTVFTPTYNRGKELKRLYESLVNQSNKFTSKINILHNGKQMDLKSIMGVMALGIPTKAKVEIIADGDDEKEAIAALSKVVKEQHVGEL